MIDSTYLKKLFDYFYYKLYDNPNFSLDMSDRHIVLISNFFKLLGKRYSVESIGVNWFFDYFAFAFAYWHDKNTKRKVTLNWILGSKMLTRWFNKTDGQMYYVDKFLLEYGISKQKCLYKEEPIITTSEEVEKLRYDGPARLYHCIQFTTLYNHTSKICMLCSNNVTCKKLLKNMYPGLYKRRGYA